MLRSLIAAAIALTGLSTPATAQTPLEAQVLSVLNFARTNPAAYAETLKTFRGFFHANLVRLPGSRVDVMTTEGVGAVDEAIQFMAQQPARRPMETGLLLASAAADHTAQQGGDGSIGHGGPDGSDPGERVRRHGGGEYVAEVIEYGAVDAVDAVRQLIVDDGVADRGHRSILFDPNLRFAGVSCGPHPVYRTMCVIDFGVTGDGRELGHMEMADARGFRGRRGE